MTVYDGKYIELAKTFLLYQTDSVPLWFGVFSTKDNKFGYARLYVYDALYDWITAHKETILEVQRLIDAGRYNEASQKIAEILADIEDTRESLLSLSAVDKNRKDNITLVVGDVVGV